MKRRTRFSRSRFAVMVCALSSCGGLDLGTAEERQLPGGAEAFSLFGEPLYPPPLAPEAREQREKLYAEARARAEKDPKSEEAIIWLGRRTAYLGRFREAIAVFSSGLELHPESARLLRHRGHRYITVRRFALAVDDLTRAAQLLRGKPDEVEPDGLPSSRGEPTSTLQFNVWYHLGLAHYLRGEFEAALRAYEECLAVSKHPERLVAATHWMYMTLARLPRPAEASALLQAIVPQMDVVENRAYHELALLYRGERDPDALLAGAKAGTTDLATVGYGVGNAHLREGRKAEAVAVFRKVIADGQWPAFGYIASEAELVRLSELPW